MKCRVVATTAHCVLSNSFVDFEQGEWWQLPLSDAVTQVWPHVQFQPRASDCDAGFIRPEQPRVHVHRALLRLQVRVPCHALRS